MKTVKFKANVKVNELLCSETFSVIFNRKYSFPKVNKKYLDLYLV